MLELNSKNIKLFMLKKIFSFLAVLGLIILGVLFFTSTSQGESFKGWLREKFLKEENVEKYGDILENDKVGGIFKKAKEEIRNEEKVFSFSYVGDVESGYETYARILKMVEAGGENFLIVGGDLTEKGTTEEFQKFKEFSEENFKKDYYPLPGNHDILKDGDGSGFNDFFGYRYKAFDYESAHFVLLDNSSAARGFDSEQLDWLENDLENNGRKFTFLFMHRPLDVPLASFVLGKDNELKEENVKRFKEILKKYRIDAIFSSHIPGYLEYKVEGIPFYASGGGGTPQKYGFLNDDFHYLKIRVQEDRFEVEKIDLD
jgi:hypothetical protein